MLRRRECAFTTDAPKRFSAGRVWRLAPREPPFQGNAGCQAVENALHCPSRQQLPPVFRDAAGNGCASKKGGKGGQKRIRAPSGFWAQKPQLWETGQRLGGCTGKEQYGWKMGIGWRSMWRALKNSKMTTIPRIPQPASAQALPAHRDPEAYLERPSAQGHRPPLLGQPPSLLAHCLPQNNGRL